MNDGFARFEQVPEKRKTRFEKNVSRVSGFIFALLLTLVALTLILFAVYGLIYAFHLVTG